MLHRRNLIVEKILKFEIDLKGIFFWFFLNFEYVFFGFFLIFEQKYVLRHKCAVLLFFEDFEIWFFCSLNLNSNISMIPDCDKLLINLTMSYCLKLWCSPKRKWCKCFYVKTLFLKFLFLELKGGTGFV
jgi:hypothetical protein